MTVSGRELSFMNNRSFCYVLFYFHEPGFSRQLGGRAVCHRLACVGATRRG